MSVPASIGFGRSLSEQKQGFFDRAAVRAAVGPVMANALSMFGAAVMVRARWSIRSVQGRKPSAPGTPPRSHSGLLRDFILFALDPETLTVVIGPSKLPGMIGDAPRALEYTGQSRAWRYGVPGGVPIQFAPRPYMRPAFEQVWPQFPQMVERARRGGTSANFSAGGSGLGNRAQLFQSYRPGFGAGRTHREPGQRSLSQRSLEGHYASGGGAR
jgi:hypothetical protein